MTQYCFDGLTYSGGSCTGTGAQAQGGRLTASGNGSSSTNYTYDALGRVSSSVQTTGQPYTFQYGYYLNGELAGIQYPSQSKYANCYDHLGRARWVKKIPSPTGFPVSCDPANPAIQAGEELRAQVESYWPRGDIQSMLLGIQSGVGFRERWCYNTRLQPVELHFGNNTANCNNQAVAGDLLTLQWTYTSSQQPGNNGNVQSQIITTPNLALTQAYTYDGENRITSITEGSNQQTWQYDSRGNRWVTSPPPPIGGFPQSPFLPIASSGYNSQNQVGIQNAQYADRGNQTAIGGMTFTYDGESRMQTSTLNGATTTYVYDGEGHRVMKQSAVGTTTYVYDAMGNLAAESDPLTTGPCTTCYITIDHLGSTRALTDSQGYVVERHDYLPFGEEIFAGTGGRTTAQQYFTDPSGEAVHTLFTGKYRDTDLAGSAMQGLDYFGTRYFSAAQGRFTSPDSTAYSSLRYPQAWNLYSYALNNPLKFVDRDGNSVQLTNCDSEQSCQKVLDAIIGATEAAKAAEKLLYVNSYKGKFFVGINGDRKALAGLSANAAKLEKMVSDTSNNVQAYLGTTFKVGGADFPVAGGYSGTKAEGYDQAFVVVDPTPSKPADADDLRGVLADGSIGNIPPANLFETMAHELFGHMFGELYMGNKAGTKANARDSVISEDEVRRTDPSRGLKIRHGQFGEVLTPADVQKLRGK